MKIDKVCRYGVVLTRLTEETIELARQWRNDPEIVQFHEYREHITQEMQKKWFQSIDNDLNHYFIIEYNNQKIGVTNLKWNTSGNYHEAGTFIGIKEFQNTIVPMRSFYALHDYAFFNLKLTELYAHIIESNTRAIRYGLKVGYRLCDHQENVTNQLYRLTPSDYDRCSIRDRKMLSRGTDTL